MKKCLYLLFLLSVFASCEKIIPVDGSDVSQQLVLNGVPSVGKELFVNFSHTRFFLDGNADVSVPGAQIEMKVNGDSYSPSHVNGCNYFFSYTVQEDDSLYVRVTADGKVAEASTYVPRMPRISDIQTIVDTTQVFNVAIVGFNLEDYADYKEYYSFTISQRDSGARMNPFTEKLDTVDTVYNTMFLCINDPALTDLDVAATEALGGYFYTRLLTTDARIDGQNHRTTLTLMMLKDTNEVAPFIHEYTLHVESVAPDRYRYLQSVDQANNMMNIFAEQAQIYGNVDGALGIFAGTAHYKVPLSLADTLPPYPIKGGCDYDRLAETLSRLSKKM